MKIEKYRKDKKDLSLTRVVIYSEDKDDSQTLEDLVEFLEYRQHELKSMKLTQQFEDRI